MPVSSQLRLNSYAKVNLFLKVLAKRRDNYHNISTLFERVSLFDTLIIRPRRDRRIKIVSSSKAIPKGPANLCYQSAKLIRDTFAADKGAEIRIIKRIPVGSGLGGGSSNAAAALIGLNKLWGLKLSRSKLAGLARKIGSDVPFFIYDCPFAAGSGRGDIIRPLERLRGVRLWHILAVPRIKVSTPYIYNQWDRKKKAGLTSPAGDVKIIPLALKRANLPLLGRAMFNSLEEVSAGLYPPIKKLKARLIQMGVKSMLMSGSGPAMFGILSSKKEALSAYKRLKRASGLSVFMVSTR